FAVVALPGEGVAVVDGQVALVAREDELDPPGESVLLGEDDVADDLFDAPLVRLGVPGRGFGRKRGQRRSERLAGGFEEARDLIDVHWVAGTTSVTGFS